MKKPTGNSNEPEGRKINQAIIDALKEYQKKHDITQNELGLRMGYTGTYASRAFSGNFTGNVDKFEAAANELLHGDGKKRAENTELVLEHFMVKPMADFLDTVHHTQDIGVAWSNAGRGKTKGIECWLKTNPTAISVTATKTRAGWNRIQDSILRQLPGKKRLKQEGWNDYLERVFTGSNRLLIVDNAHLLHESGRAWIAYDWHEATGCPVALVGNPEIVGQWAKNDQHHSRVGLAREIKPVSNAIDSARELIRLHLPQAVGDLATAHLTVKIIKGMGACRAAKKHLLLASELLKTNAYAKPAEAFRAAHTQLLSTVRLDDAA